MFPFSIEILPDFTNNITQLGQGVCYYQLLLYFFILILFNFYLIILGESFDLILYYNQLCRHQKK